MKKSVALLTALMLSACVATPPTTPQVTEVKSENLGLTGAPAVRVPSQWWKAFNDPQVDRLAEHVMAGNPSLQAALARMRAAQAELAANRAEDLPQLNLNGSEQRTLFSKNYIIPPPYGGTWHWYGSLTADLSWNLDFWGKQSDLIKQAGARADAAALDAEAAHLALSGTFAQAYINLLLDYQNEEIAAQAVKEREAIFNLTKGRYEAGLEIGGAVSQAAAVLAQARADQLRFAAAKEMDVHAIAALAGLGADSYATITRPAPNLDVALPLPTSLPADLLSRRPDILASKARVEAAVQGRAAAKADFYPDINLAAMAGFQSLGLSNLLTGGSFTFGMGPAIHLPIFDAGKLKAQYAKSTADLDEAVANYNGAVLNAIKQTADAMTQVKSLEAQRAEQQEAVNNAARSLLSAQERYRSGLATQLPMLNAENTLLQARQALAAVTAAGAQQRIILLLTVGGAWEPGANPQIAKQDISHD